MVGELIRIVLPAIIKDDGAGDAEPSDDVLLNEPSYVGGGDGGDRLNLYPLGEVVHSLSSELQGTDNRR